jgi:hypothetical protein
MLGYYLSPQRLRIGAGAVGTSAGGAGAASAWRLA